MFVKKVPGIRVIITSILQELPDGMGGTIAVADRAIQRTAESRDPNALFQNIFLFCNLTFVAVRHRTFGAPAYLQST